MGSWTIIPGTLTTVALMLASLWGWQHADGLVEEWSRPDVAANAVRCAAVALGAGAQVVLLGWVVGRVYKAGQADTVLGLAAAGVCTVAIVSAVTLALVGR